MVLNIQSKLSLVFNVTIVVLLSHTIYSPYLVAIRFNICFHHLTTFISQLLSSSEYTHTHTERDRQ